MSVNLNALCIWSGGQTGADRGALKAAKLMGFNTYGYVPDGYETEIGPDKTLREFGLVEIKGGYSSRTKMNVRDTDATIWFGDKGSPGGKLTLRECIKLDKPTFLARYGMLSQDSTAVQITDFMLNTVPNLRNLNVAGNRESSNSGIEEYVYTVMTMALTQLAMTDYISRSNILSKMTYNYNPKLRG